MNSNQTKVIAGLTLLSLLLLVAGYFTDERQGLLGGLLLALGFVGLALYFTAGHWIEHFRAKELEGSDAWGLIETTNELSQRAKINPPQIYVSPLAIPTALSLGHHSQNGKIIICQSLLNSFDSDEIRAVLAHEIARIKRGETFPVGALSGVMAPFFLLGQILDFALRLLTLGLAGKISVFSRLAHLVYAAGLRGLVQSSSYYETDRQAAHLIQNPESLARVLMKLESYAMTHEAKPSPSASAFMVVNPSATRGVSRYLQSQPTVPQRIQKLTGHYPL